MTVYLTPGDYGARPARLSPAEAAAWPALPSAREAAKMLGGKIGAGGNIMCPGPGHSREDRSLSVRLDPSAPDGFVVNSLAGDDVNRCRDHVRERLGLPAWQPRPRLQTREFIYRREDGSPHVRVRRFDKPDGTKGFAQDHWTGRDWQKGLNGAERILYRLPDLLADPGATVFIVEGEKCADALAELGFVATTNPEGAGKWRDELSAALAGREVVILPDNDEPGREHATTVAASVAEHAAGVRVLTLPGLPHKGDVVDWLEAGGTADELARLAGEAPAWDAAPHEATHGTDVADLANMSFPPIRWVVPSYIPEGLTLFAGAPKIGKSWFCLDIALAVALGGTALDKVECELGAVLYAALEDNPRRLQRRLDTMLPDRSRWPARGRMRVWYDMPRLDQGGVEAVARWIEATPDARLVIIDTFAMVRPEGDDRRGAYQQDTAALKPLQQLASETGIAIVVVHHTRKMAADDPLSTVSGTNGLAGVADTTLVLAREPLGVTLYGRGRDVEEIETAMRFDRDLCRWEAMGAAADVQRSQERNIVLQVLREAGEPLSVRDVAEEAGMKDENARFLLRKLVRDGLARKPERGRYAYAAPVAPVAPEDEEREENRDDRTGAEIGAGEWIAPESGAPDAATGATGAKHSGVAPEPEPTERRGNRDNPDRSGATGATGADEAAHVLAILEEADHPLTDAELRIQLNRRLGTKLHTRRVAGIVTALKIDGRVEIAKHRGRTAWRVKR